MRHCGKREGCSTLNARQARPQRLGQLYVSIKVDREGAKRFLEGQEARQEVTGICREGSYVPVAAREEFECDLAEFGDGPRYVLACSDVFSKCCAAVPMDDKRPATPMAALGQCFAELGMPVRIYTDEGADGVRERHQGRVISLAAGDPGDGEKRC